MIKRNKLGQFTSDPRPETKKRVFIKCKSCGNKFQVKLCRKKTAKYCSYKCKGLSLKGKPSWNAGMSGTYKLNIPSRIGICNNTGRTHFKKGELVGDKCHRWKGGITSKNQEQRDIFSVTVIKNVYRRDNYTCQICGARQDLQVDHIKSWSQHPELRFDMDNCRTLCRPCHYLVTFNKQMPPDSRWGRSNMRNELHR